MNYTKPTSQDLRRANRSEILRKIYFDGPISRLEISRDLGISPATVTNISTDLITKGIIIEAGQKPSEGGRPSSLLQINPEFGYFIGIEVGETFIQFELFDITFKKLHHAFLPLTEYKIEPLQVVDILVNGIENLISTSGISHEDVIGVGIGFPGLVDPVKGVSVFTPNWGWHDISITALMEERLSIPMYLDNGAKSMAVAEMLFGAGQGIANLAVLLVGTGVGAGIISNRKLFRGFSNNAGEFGHTTVNLAGPVCRCGSRGCLEVYIGANGIIQRYQSLDPIKAANLPAEQTASVERILTNSLKGDPAAQRVIEDTIQHLGAGLANLINAYNPQLVLLGGWSGMLLGKHFLEKIQETISYYALEQSLAVCELKLCQLGQGAVTIGAAALALEHFFETAGEAEGIMIGGEVF